MKEFTRIETLAGVKRTIFNQYDALERPLESWLAKQGVRFLKAFTVTNLDLTDVDGKLAVTGLTYQSNGKPSVVAIDSVDLVFLQNASMTDASSLGSMTRAPRAADQEPQRRLADLGEARERSPGTWQPGGI